MNNAESKSLSEINSEVEAIVARLLHEFRNQLGGLKLYAAFLRKSLANNTLDVAEGIEVCDKILQQIDALTVQAKETARSINAPRKQ
ncbi:MAG: hypothetical protein JST84_19200 [Acidobacteria bacterium]|nr:hypothetical protein [Acidobacteriota bacterium]